MHRSSLLKALEDRIEATALRLETELGTETACTLHSDGRVTGGAKYLEGRLIACRELVTALNEAAHEPVAGVLAGHVARWQAELDRHAGRGPTQWAAYATGGLDAVTEACCLADAPCGTR